jgi:hypothetical protein
MRSDEAETTNLSNQPATTGQTFQPVHEAAIEMHTVLSAHAASTEHDVLDRIGVQRQGVGPQELEVIVGDNFVVELFRHSQSH